MQQVLLLSSLLPESGASSEYCVFLRDALVESLLFTSSLQVIMTATPRQALAGEVVTLTWGVTEGTAEFHDWLGLFSENDDKKPLRHCYVKTNKVFPLGKCRMCCMNM